MNLVFKQTKTIIVLVLFGLHVSHVAQNCLGQEDKNVTTSEVVIPESPSKPSSLNSHLSIFEPLIGKTFRGEFAGSTPEKPVVDISTYERAMNGQAVRSFHSINDGEYGGETIFMWDAKQQKIAFWYFTTAGFQTQGTMDIEGNTWSSMEEVTGNENGITKVRAVSKLLENGDLQISSEYFANDKWSPGRETLYKIAPDAKVKFK